MESGQKYMSRHVGESIYIVTGQCVNAVGSILLQSNITYIVYTGFKLSCLFIVINSWCTCAARVIVVGSVCAHHLDYISLHKHFFSLKLIYITYLTGTKISIVFSENALLLRLSGVAIVLHTFKVAIFSP